MADKKTEFISKYTPSLLESIPRKDQREKLGIGEELPFNGMDIWNAYEFSWLNDKGKPEVAVAEFEIPGNSPSLIESKSMKLYLGLICATISGKGFGDRITVDQHSPQVN